MELMKNVRSKINVYTVYFLHLNSWVNKTCTGTIKLFYKYNYMYIYMYMHIYVHMYNVDVHASLYFNFVVV